MSRWALAAWAMILAGLGFRIWGGAHAQINFDQAWFWTIGVDISNLKNFPTFGSVITGTEARVPSPLFHYITALPHLISDHPRAGSTFFSLLHAGAAGLGGGLDDPGMLTAVMLLQGDDNHNGFDPVRGAGALTVEAPVDAAWGAGRVCVPDRQAVSVPLPAAPHGTLRAVAWWYDRRQERGIVHDRIDLAVLVDGDEVATSEAPDHKQRVVVDTPGGFTAVLELRGRAVTSTEEGCGDRAMRVHFAYRIE